MSTTFRVEPNIFCILIISFKKVAEKADSNDDGEIGYRIKIGDRIKSKNGVIGQIKHKKWSNWSN